jgi:hypothetical protein
MARAHSLPIASAVQRFQNYDRALLINNLKSTASSHLPFKSITMRRNEKTFAHISRTLKRLLYGYRLGRQFRLYFVTMRTGRLFSDVLG